ncbi:hypothetical protein [Bradyrhizobium cosmicum]|uniref:Uncharacterized protein n=1 Tax=Bradyrhizobium cosmicum TaxID=1404864 RepID=A0AAI8ME72_9BRAD|nr:hypothetical protein [Bradyrhizobium cosmicum]BAL76829.1 hypothetical protein S23_36300 [Bradyrhizobium cosmicum]
MKQQLPPSDQVFILRFWREFAGPTERGHWRVQVRNINTCRRDVVDNVQGAFSIISADLNAAVTENEGHDGPGIEALKRED